MSADTTARARETLFRFGTMLAFSPVLVWMGMAIFSSYYFVFLGTKLRIVGWFGLLLEAGAVALLLFAVRSTGRRQAVIGALVVALAGGYISIHQLITAEGYR